VEGSPHAKNQLDSSSSFDTMSACDEQTDGQTALAYGRVVKSVGPYVKVVFIEIRKKIITVMNIIGADFFYGLGFRHY